MFIRLTEVLGNDTTKSLTINKDCIHSFQKSSKGKDTHIRMTDKSYFFVRETEQQIWDMLNI